MNALRVCVRERGTFVRNYSWYSWTAAKFSLLLWDTPTPLLESIWQALPQKYPAPVIKVLIPWLPQVKVSIRLPSSVCSYAQKRKDGDHLNWASLTGKNKFRKHSLPVSVTALTFGWNSDPVEVTREFLRHVGLPSRRQADHHDHRWRIRHVGGPCCTGDGHLSSPLIETLTGRILQQKCIHCHPCRG